MEQVGTVVWCLLLVGSSVLHLFLERGDLVLEPANVALLIHAQCLEELNFLAELCNLRWLVGGRLAVRR